MSGMFEGLREAYRRDGFVVVRGLLEVEEAMALRQRLVEHSGVTDADFDDVGDGVPRKWTSPAGVAQVPAFQHLLVDERLVGLAREVLGPEAVYLHHNDLHAGYSSPGWHRDNVHRTFGQGEDWDESTTPYRCARIALYLQTHAESGFKFGLIPGSHRRESRLVRWERRAPRFSTVRRMVMGQGLAFARARWIATEPGDVVIFDHRVLHCGGRTRGPKYSIYLGAGIQNDHFNRHWSYYRDLRSDLHYPSVPEALRERLQSEGLWPKAEVPVLAHVDHAFLPKAA